MGANEGLWVQMKVNRFIFLVHLNPSEEQFYLDPDDGENHRGM